MGTERILTRGLSKSYRLGDSDLHVLKNVSLRIDAGEYAAIVGPSGSGKSTLLNLLGCLDSPTNGEYFLDGIPTHTLDDAKLAEVRNRKIGFVFQSFNLLPRMTAVANVALPLVYTGETRRDRRRIAEATLDRVGLAHRREHRPSELSGGERQRVAIARALVTRPSILLADEPTGNLDQKVGAGIIEMFEDLHRSGGMTLIVITHDMAVAGRCPRRIRLVDGEVVEDRRAA